MKSSVTVVSRDGLRGSCTIHDARASFAVMRIIWPHARSIEYESERDAWTVRL